MDEKAINYESWTKNNYKTTYLTDQSADCPSEVKQISRFIGHLLLTRLVCARAAVVTGQVYNFLYTTPQQLHCLSFSHSPSNLSPAQEDKKSDFPSPYIFRIHTITRWDSRYIGSYYATTSLARKQLVVGKSHDFAAERFKS